jgi:hypothetical protein
MPRATKDDDVTQALPFTEARIARVIRAARKEGIIGGITVHLDGSY